MSFVLPRNEFMTLCEFDQKKAEVLAGKFVGKRRPPENIRDKADLGFRIKGQHVEIFEIRPIWDDPSQIVEESVAKATYVKSKKCWKIYWMRADLKWHRYDPVPEVEDIEEFFHIVDDDEFCCFWG